MKVSEAFDIFLERKKGILEDSTLYQYKYVRDLLDDFAGDKKLSKFGIDDVQVWKERLLTHMSPRSAATCITALRSMLHYWENLGEKCLDRTIIEKPKFVPNERWSIKPSDVSRIIEHCRTIPEKLAVSILYGSGLRVSEVANLNRDDVERGGNGEVTFNVLGKGRKRRHVRADERTVEILEKHLCCRDDNCPALILGALSCTRVNPKVIARWVVKASDRAGLPKQVTPHILRHSFATDYIKNGGDIGSLSKQLGHSNITVTMIYVHYDQEKLNAQHATFHSF